MRYFPQIIVGSIFLALLAGVFCYSAVQFSSSESQSTAPVKVALVTNNNEQYLDYAMGLVNQMNSIKEYFTFEMVDEETGYELLDRGEVIALMILPNQMVEGILSGTNDHARVILSGTDPLSSVIMKEISLAASSLISSSQASIYATCDLYIKEGYGDSLAGPLDYLNMTEISLALSRSDAFKNVLVSPTGAVTYTDYYLCSAILFVLLISGCGYILFFSRGTRDLQLKIKSAKLGFFFPGLASFVSVFIYQLFLGLLCYGGICFYLGSRGDLNPALALSIFALLLILLFASSGYIFFLLSLSPESPVSVLVIFLVSACMMLLSGCFIPLSFLPMQIREFSPQIPTSHMHKQLLSILQSTPDSMPSIFSEESIWLLCFGLITFALGILAGALINGRRMRK